MAIAALLATDSMRAPLFAQDKGALREAYCAFRTTPAQREICLEKGLTRLDAALNDVYAELRQKMTARQFTPVRDEQRTWLADRDRCKADTACLRTKYQDRTAQLEQYLENVSFSKMSHTEIACGKGNVSPKGGCVREPKGRDPLANRMVWRMQETGRGNARGVRLDFSVPETDAIAFSAVCNAGSYSADLEFGYPTRGLREGEKVALNLDLGSYQASEPGVVFGTNRQEGVSGVKITLVMDDAFWPGMLNGSSLSYRRRNEAPVRLDLKGSAGEVKSFVAACQALSANRPSAVPVAGGQLRCKALGKVQSIDDIRPTARNITFVNRTRMYRGVMWLDQNGRPVDKGNLAAGQRMTVSTFRNHVWMFTDGPGNCTEMYLVKAGETAFEIKKPNPVGVGD